MAVIMMILLIVGAVMTLSKWGSPPQTDDFEEFKQEAPGRFLNCLIIFGLFVAVGWLIIVLAAGGALGG